MKIGKDFGHDRHGRPGEGRGTARQAPGGELWEIRLKGRSGISRAGLTQAQLAQRMETTQSAIAELLTYPLQPSEFEL